MWICIYINNFVFNEYREVINFSGFVVCKELNISGKSNSDCNGKVNERSI